MLLKDEDWLGVTAPQTKTPPVKPVAATPVTEKLFALFVVTEPTTSVAPLPVTETFTPVPCTTVTESTAPVAIGTALRFHGPEAQDPLFQPAT